MVGARSAYRTALAAFAVSFIGACTSDPVSSDSPVKPTVIASCEASNTCYTAPLPAVTDNQTLPPPPCGALYRNCSEGGAEAGLVVGGDDASSGREASTDASARADGGDAGTTADADTRDSANATASDALVADSAATLASDALVADSAANLPTDASPGIDADAPVVDGGTVDARD